MATAVRNSTTTNGPGHDISGVFDEAGRNSKIDRLNRLSNTFDKRNDSNQLGSDRESAMTQPNEVSLLSRSETSVSKSSRPIKLDDVS